MKQSVMICEGSTDYALLQYYMRKALSWADVEDNTRQNKCIRNKGQRSRLLEKNGNELTIMASGGSSRIPEALRSVIKKAILTPPDCSDVYDRIVILTDRDECSTEADMLASLSNEMASMGITSKTQLECKKWIECSGKAQVNVEFSFKILILIIPFDEEGALETFLLNAVSAKDPYDKDIVDCCNEFVDNADPDRRYLIKRSYITKAKFDAFFSIRSSADQFNERRKVFLSVDWENYSKVNECFALFADL